MFLKLLDLIDFIKLPLFSTIKELVYGVSTG